MLQSLIRFFLYNRLVSVILLLILIFWGLSVSPFYWNNTSVSNPVPVDAIPDIGENQQIIYTEWKGRSPQDIEDQVSYPLTSALLGVPGVKTIRSHSIFGLSTVYLIFDEDVEFYWSRSRILEKLNSLPQGLLPEGVSPTLGPDATALGQIFWYTLEGKDSTGATVGGWDPQELRTLQDYYVGYALGAVEGVSEVASVGGFVKEYHIDIDPLSLSQYNITLSQVIKAVQSSNKDVGARTLEFNRAEYLIRGLGYIESIQDLEQSVIMSKDQVPVRLADIARVSVGPAERRGGLDKEGMEAVGAVIVARYGSNPMEVIEKVKEKIEEISTGLPQKQLADGTLSKVTIVPFYDRSTLIKETISTLENALTHEVLISIIVVIVLVFHLRASLIISGILPVAVLTAFILMRYTGVDANVVALSGIAIAIGVMVDIAIIIVENIIRHFENAKEIVKRKVDVIYEAVIEVAPAVVTALATTVISFLPVFFLEAEEGKLFKPLAFTKTYALLGALLLGLFIVPTLAYFILNSGKPAGMRPQRKWLKPIVYALLGIIGTLVTGNYLFLALILLAVSAVLKDHWPLFKPWQNITDNAIILLTVAIILAKDWLPLGVSQSVWANVLFVILLLGGILAILHTIVKKYPSILAWCLAHRLRFILIPVFLLILGYMSWQGFSGTFGGLARGAAVLGWEVDQTAAWRKLDHLFPPLGKEFMPSLDEGSFLLMPTTMTHSGVEENREVIQKLDNYVGQIPEVEQVVGKWGRVNSALDPAPISMFENTINYKSEYILDHTGNRARFRYSEKGFELRDGSFYNPDKDPFISIPPDQLIEDKSGQFFRQWRPHIMSPDDIWEEIISAASIPGLTSAPKLQPIETRLVMLSTGMRAPMGIKVYGKDLESIESAGLKLEKLLQTVEGIEPQSVFADRIVGKPYLEIDIDRAQIARYGLSIEDVQNYIEISIGGKVLTTAVDGRERMGVKLRYARDFRNSPEELSNLLITVSPSQRVPLGELAEITYRKGAQLIRSEDTFLTGYVIFDKSSNFSEVDVVVKAEGAIEEAIRQGTLLLPEGVTYKFTGNYEKQARAGSRLAIVIPVSLIIIFLILYFQFRSVAVSLMVFSGVFVAFAGGFIMVWLYGQSWFMDFTWAGTQVRDMFSMETVNMSVAVWVGFIALFGIATDDGVIMGTYIQQSFKNRQVSNLQDIRNAVIEAGGKRVRPAVMTAATAIIALLPVLTSTGKGSDIMVPMAIPVLGGMIFQVITMFVVPVLYYTREEFKWNKKIESNENS